MLVRMPGTKYRRTNKSVHNKSFSTNFHQFAFGQCVKHTVIHTARHMLLSTLESKQNVSSMCKVTLYLDPFTYVTKFMIKQIFPWSEDTKNPREKKIITSIAYVYMQLKLYKSFIIAQLHLNYYYTNTPRNTMLPCDFYYNS